MIRLLDVCCGEGGCSKGYADAAKSLGIKIHITGVDIINQPNYPYKFVQMDAVYFLKNYGHLFTHIHASPPCQEHSISTTSHKKRGIKYTDILNPVRKQIIKIGKPSVIENVPGAPMRKDVVLRGDMFGLKVLRERWFELHNWFMLHHEKPLKIGSVVNGDYVIVAGHCSGKKSGNNKNAIPHWKGNKSWYEVWKIAMNIDWMSKEGLSQAIPPDYTKYIGMEFFTNYNPYNNDTTN